MEEAIREVEIVQRIFAEIGDELPYDGLRTVIQRETDLSESSVARRSSTVAQWIAMLQEIKVRPDGRSKKLVRV